MLTILLCPYILERPRVPDFSRVSSIRVLVLLQFFDTFQGYHIRVNNPFGCFRIPCLAGERECPEKADMITTADMDPTESLPSAEIQAKDRSPVDFLLGKLRKVANT